MSGLELETSDMPSILTLETTYFVARTRMAFIWYSLI